MRVKLTEQQLAALGGDLVGANQNGLPTRQTVLGAGAQVRRSTPPAPLERDIQRAVVALLEARGAVLVRVNGGMMPYGNNRRVRFSFATVGTCSDLIACYLGRPLALEVKRPGEKPTDGQRLFLDAWERAGGTAAVVYSAAEAEALLNGIG